MKSITSNAIAATVAAIWLSACVNDLNISSIDPQTSSFADDMGLLAKCYSTLGLTGQAGPAGNGDLSDDEGESGFYRTTFNCEELPTDECIWAWQTDTDIPQLTNITWNSSSIRTQWVYTRLTYDITLFNSYLDSVEDSEANRHYRAEVRFLRALHYWYMLDLFGKSPFKDHFDMELPVEMGGADLYDWIDGELTEIEGLLAPMGSFNNASDFGRADQGAAYMLHARLALNSGVYTKGAKAEYAKAVGYCDMLIDGGAYGLSSMPRNGYSGYAQLFMADNDENPDAMGEIIFPIRQDGARTRCFSGAAYLVSSTRLAGMPYMGTTNGWSCNFSRAALVRKFFPNLDDCPLSTEEAPTGATEADIIALDLQDGTSTRQVIAKAGDDRAMLYTGRGGGVRRLQTGVISNFLDGASIVKWNNYRSDQPYGDWSGVHDTEYPDLDIPLFRLAEAYLTRAEAKWRLGDAQTALDDINTLRARANAGAMAAISSEMDILDEWCREFYMEGRRRSDLVRFDCFTTNKYIWDWKGGEPDGRSVDSHFNVYPIPYDDIMNNGNLTQNAGY